MNYTNDLLKKSTITAPAFDVITNTKKLEIAEDQVKEQEKIIRGLLEVINETFHEVRNGKAVEDVLSAACQRRLFLQLKYNTEDDVWSIGERKR